IVCFDTPTSRATSSTARPASTCFKAAIISASLCLLRDMLIPLSFDEIIINFVRNQGSRSDGYFHKLGRAQERSGCVRSAQLAAQNPSQCKGVGHRLSKETKSSTASVASDMS